MRQTRKKPELVKLEYQGKTLTGYWSPEGYFVTKHGRLKIQKETAIESRY